MEAFGTAQDALEAGDRVLAEQRFRDVAEQWMTEPLPEDELERIVGVGAAAMLGTVLYELGRPDEAEVWWRRAAEAGTGQEWPGFYLGGNGRAPHADAAANLGDALAQRGEIEEAIRWTREAAELGHAGAATSVGAECYARGVFEEADRWWRQAAEHGYGPALYNLGTLTAEQGDVGAAEGWFRRAAESERGAENAELHASVVANAAAEVGILLAQRGAMAEAREWLVRGAKAGSEGAAEALAQLDGLERASTEAQGWMSDRGPASSDSFLERWRRKR